MEAKYRIKISQPTVAVFLENGRHVARTLPAGDIINADTLDGNELIEVQLAQQTVRMFAQDIRNRGELLDCE